MVQVGPELAYSLVGATTSYNHVVIFFLLEYCYLRISQQYKVLSLDLKAVGLGSLSQVWQ